MVVFGSGVFGMDGIGGVEGGFVGLGIEEGCSVVEKVEVLVG